MSLGVILIELHNKLIGLDGQGNLVLNTKGQLAESVQLGNTPGLVGPGIGNNYAITNGPGASANICNVLFQLTDSLGNPLSRVANFEIMLSDSATGAGLTATTPSGGVAAVAGEGVILSSLVASKLLAVQTNAAGLFGLAITDTAKTPFFPVALRLTAAPAVGAQLTTASYHT
jgi:hypothetical protein